MTMAHKVNREVSDWIKWLRIRAGISIEDAARLIGHSERRLIRFEGGQPVHLNVLAKIVHAYKVDREECLIKIMEIQGLLKQSH